jgi:hypothetical protein
MCLFMQSPSDLYTARYFKNASNLKRRFLLYECLYSQRPIFKNASLINIQCFVFWKIE